ncbi:MAG: DUF6686 family protein [Bacteroidota bacterium]
MCKYTILAERPAASVRYCHCCKTYNVIYNNLIMNFERGGFQGFKSHLSECYDYNVHTHCCEHRDFRDIKFNTRLEGLQFLFSTREVGELLALIQEAELSDFLLEKA